MFKEADDTLFQTEEQKTAEMRCDAMMEAMEEFKLTQVSGLHPLGNNGQNQLTTRWTTSWTSPKSLWRNKADTDNQALCDGDLTSTSISDASAQNSTQTLRCILMISLIP